MFVTNIIKFLIVFYCFNAASLGLAQDQSKFTQPQPAKEKAADQLRIAPAFEIPQHPEKYVWKITNKINGKAISTGSVKVYGDSGTNRLPHVGEIAEGTEVTLDEVKIVGGMHYYSIKWTYGDSPDQKKMAAAGRTKAWVSGLYIIPTQLR